MSETAGPQGVGEHPMGSHRLGPHVVGQRVVVRHLLEDGRATDVLGTCLAWTAEHAVVDRDGDGPVRIPLAAIVTGKPVPPRASVRNRAAPKDVERHVATLWDDVEVVEVGDWQLRATRSYDGSRRRGNSLLAMGVPGAPVEEVARRAVDFYDSRRRPALAQVVRGSEEESALLGQGWRSLGSGETHCQLASVATALRSSRGTAPDVPVQLTESPERLQVTLEDGTATGRAVLADDWLLLEGLHVEPEHRRRRLGTAVVVELLDWGASRGARTAMLHVEVDDPSALAFHERLGFLTHHTNRYLVAST